MTAVAITKTTAIRRLPLVLGAIALLGLAIPAAGASAADRRHSLHTLTNGPRANAVKTYVRTARGKLKFRARTPTGGVGTGEGLGSQGSLVVSDSRRRMFAVNPGSDSVSMFDLTGRRPELLGVVPSGGERPISLDVAGRRLYVLNAGGAGSVATFAVRRRGLSLRASWTRPLGAGGADPAQVGLSPDRGVLVVTEKDSSTIDTYVVNARGRPGSPVSHPSAGDVPFGFDFDRRGRLLVSNASGSASSYRLGGKGALRLISGPLDTRQQAPCWLVSSKNGRYAYVANAQSRSITGLRVRRDGGLRLLEQSGVSARLRTGSTPIDEAVSPGGRFLYVLDAGRHGVDAFRIRKGGALKRVRGIGKAPPHAAGLATG